MCLLQLQKLKHLWMKISRFLKKNLLQRTVSAILGGGLLLGAVLYGPFTFFAAFLLIMGLAQWELYNLLEIQGAFKPFRLGGLLMSGLLFTLCFAWQKESVEAEVFLWLLPLFFVLFAQKLLSVKQLSQRPFIDIALTLLGTVYVGGSFSMANWLVFKERGGSYDYRLLIGLMLMMWVFDSGAYFVGKLIGRHKIMPKVSPKKSWEGFLGGLLAAVGVSLWLSRYDNGLERWEWIIVAVLVTVVGTVGDLSESLLKRTSGMKDSGKLIPGHGGFLDRFDALLFVMAFVTPILLLLSE